mgnify:CR=1 FL=1
MENLINKLSEKLQSKLKDYNVSIVFIEFNELNVRSEYDMDISFYEAIESELKKLGYEID